MKKLALLFFLFLAFSPAFLAQDKNPISHEVMWSLKRVGIPAISPDGKWAVFSVLEASYDEKEQVSDLWIVPTDGSESARKITGGKAGEGAYSWSPNGRTLAFTATRDGDEVGQVYLLDLQRGGEAQKITKLSSGASSPEWSPDGRMILFTSNVYPQCYEDSTQKKMVEEKKKIKYKARVYTDFPVRNWDKWLDEKQTHLYVQFAHPDSAARNLFKTVEISKVSGFSYLQSCWAPDGKGVIFAATTEKNTAAYQEPRSQLYHVSLSGDDARILTGDSWEYSAPECSPDGKYLYAFGNETNNNKVYNLNRLVRFDWPAMTNRKVLAENLDRPMHQFLPREDRILLSVEDQGRDRIYSLSPDGGTLQRLDHTALGCLTNISCSSSGTPVIVCQQESTLSPPEIARINADGTTTLLTRFNVDKLNALDMDAGQTLWFKSKRGKNIRSLMIRPPGFDPAKKYPLFIVIHGGPAGSWKESWSYRWNYQLLAKPGYVLLMTDFTGSTGYGERFSQDIQFDPFKGPGEEIQEAAADAIKRFSFIDADRQAAGGASYGGHLANWLQATTRHYKCLISHAGLVNSISQWGTSDYIFGREVMNGGVPWGSSKVWREQNPFRYADQFKTPMLVTIGELDYRVPLNNSLENWNILQRNKIPSKLIVFPDENHWILKGENSRFFYSELQAWLAQYLK